MIVEKPESVLFLHMGSSLVSPWDPIRSYYTRVYRRFGVKYPSKDMFEIPKWMALASYVWKDIYPDRRIQVLLDLDDYLDVDDNTVIAGSVMDSTLGLWRVLCEKYPKRQFLLGGYVPSYSFLDLSNVRYLNSLYGEDGARQEEQYDYGLFVGWGCTPRLTLSRGCLHKCSFCSVDKRLALRPKEEVIREAESFGVLDFNHVYIDDKTFGQAENWSWIKEIHDLVKQFRGSFRGFIVQTTSPNVIKHAEQWSEMGVRIIEVGVETMDSNILRRWKKPHTPGMIWKAANTIEHLRAQGHDLLFVPNIIFGIPAYDGVPHDYSHTVSALREWYDMGIMPYMNPYVLSVYHDARGPEDIAIIADGVHDANETSLHKSWLDCQEQSRVTEILQECLDITSSVTV